MESKKVEFFNKLSFIILIATIFGGLFFFIPYSPVSLDASKGFLLSIGATISLFFWLISRLGDGKFVIPKDKLIMFAGTIPLVFLISSFFSHSFYISLFGSGFEIGTFGSMLILFIIFFLSAIHFQTEKRVWYFLGSIFIAGIILVVFQLINTLIGFNRILPGLLQGVSSSNLVGSWNDFAFVIGLVTLLSLLTLELTKTKLWVRITQYILLVIGLFFLIIINLGIVWLMLGILSLVIFVYSISIQHANARATQTEGLKKFPFASLIILFVSLALLVGSNLLTTFVSNYVSLNNNTIRPSVVTTSQIAWKAFLHNPVLGTGPNTFSIDWSLWQPKDIAQTVFWSVDFTSGYSLFTTFASTSGLLGFASIILFLIIFFTRSIQSIKMALSGSSLNYFMMSILMTSIYSWIIFIFHNSNIVMLSLAFVSSGILIGMLVSKQAIPVKKISFLDDPRSSFFSILGLVVLMVISASLAYIYIEKFTSIMYFSRGVNPQNTMESLSKSERTFIKAISLDKNDYYYRSLSQIYISQINLLVNDKSLSEDILKSSLQQLVNNAQQSASLAVNQNPKQYQNYMNLGNVYASLVPFSVSNSYESSMAAYEKAITLAPNNPSVDLAKASLEYLNKNNSEARKYIKQALELKPNYIDAIFLLVQIETNEGNLSEAIKKAEYAGELAPNDSTVFFRLGLLRYNNSDYKGAISSFERAVLLDNSYLNARYFLGQAYKKVGRKTDALTQFNLLASVLPEDQNVKDAISSVSSGSSTAEVSDEKEDTESVTKPPLKEKK